MVGVSLTAAACGGGDAGPTGVAVDVIRATPDVTLAGKTANVIGAAPGYEATGTVDFVTGVDDLKLKESGRYGDPISFGVIEPAAALDLIRGATNIEAYGGSEVQGIGTKRYQIDIDLEKAIAATPAARQTDLIGLRGKIGPNDTIWADVFVDKQGRVRRVLYPVRVKEGRPYRDDDRIPKMVSVDYFDFGGSK